MLIHEGRRTINDGVFALTGFDVPSDVHYDGTTLVYVDTHARWQYEPLELQRGDVILAYTDGLTEALNFADEAFGRERVQQAALAAIAEGQSAEGIVRQVLWTMRRFAGLLSRLDDLTLIAIRVL